MRPFIVFFGPEGAGKTTQIKLLVRLLKVKYGLRDVEVISIRDNHLLIPLVISFIKRLGFRKYLRYGDEYIEVADVERVVRDKRIWALFQLFNILPLYIIRYSLKRKLLRKLLIADRFIPDSLATLAHFMRDPQLLDKKIARLYIGLIPRDAYLIFLYAPYDSLIARYRKRKSLTEPPDLIYYQILIGLKLLKLLKNRRLIINTHEKSIIETHNIIVDFLRYEMIDNDSKI